MKLVIWKRCQRKDFLGYQRIKDYLIEVSKDLDYWEYENRFAGFGVDLKQEGSN
jgi:hypothetical protein